MREMTVRITFTSPALGNAKSPRDGRFELLRGPDGRVIFPSAWHHANLRFAAQVRGMHQTEVGKICWDVRTDLVLEADRWHRRPLKDGGAGRRRYVLHEAVLAGQTMGINVVVPSAISDADFWSLMATAGQYRGLSPWRPGEFGFFTVAGLRRRVGHTEAVVEPEGAAVQ